MNTATKIADLTHRNVTNKGIEDGRRNWESTCAGDLIAMFAAAGYDVVRCRVDGKIEDESKCDSRSREVRDQNGNTVAYILWCISIPNYACAMTPKNF